VNLFIAAFREVPLWDQVKILLRAWFSFHFESDEQGYHWFLRLPLFMVESKKNWHVVPWAMGQRVSGALLGFWPNLPLRDGGFIYRWQKGWFE
jgi:hypothetical protein